MLVEIVEYTDELSKIFYELNIEWLERFFYVEDHDKVILSNPKKYIIDKGGIIIFVKIEGLIVGTVALMPTNKKSEFELTKMAVNPNYRNNKIGHMLMNESIKRAKFKKITKLVLYSNRILKNAIYLYNKFKFEEVKMEKDTPYNRADIKMELTLSN